jgi:hypothetical protein
METERLPWLLAVLTAAWFAWLAHRMGRNLIIWAVGGGAFGLVTSTLVIGLGHATTIPFSEHERKVAEMKWAIAAAMLIGVIGWMLTAGLHRHRQFLWQKPQPVPDPAPPAPGNPAAQTSSKPPVKPQQTP